MRGWRRVIRDNSHTLTRICACLRWTPFGPPRVDIRGCSLDLEISCLRCHLIGDSVFMRLCHRWRLVAKVNRLAEVAANLGGLNRSMQHWLAVYSPAFESPRSLAGVG
jgi:hypothetical protein